MVTEAAPASLHLLLHAGAELAQVQAQVQAPRSHKCPAPRKKRKACAPQPPCYRERRLHSKSRHCSGSATLRGRHAALRQPQTTAQGRTIGEWFQLVGLSQVGSTVWVLGEGFSVGGWSCCAVFSHHSFRSMKPTAPQSAPLMSPQSFPVGLFYPPIRRACPRLLA